MAGWVLVVRELYERGPLTIKEFRAQSAPGQTTRYLGSDLARATRLGLIKPPGRGGHQPRPYVLTPAGVAFAENRLAPVWPGYTPRPGRCGVPRGHRVVLRPTWLASLPATNTIRL